MAKRCTTSFKRRPCAATALACIPHASHHSYRGGEAERISRPRALILLCRRQSRIATADAQGERKTTLLDAKCEKAMKNKKKRCKKNVFPASDDGRPATRVGKARAKQAWLEQQRTGPLLSFQERRGKRGREKCGEVIFQIRFALACLPPFKWALAVTHTTPGAEEMPGGTEDITERESTRLDEAKQKTSKKTKGTTTGC